MIILTPSNHHSYPSPPGVALLSIPADIDIDTAVVGAADKRTQLASEDGWPWLTAS